MFLYILVGFLLGVAISLVAVLVAVYSLFMRVGTQQAQQKTMQPIEIKHSFAQLPPPAQNSPIETCIWLNTIVTRVCTAALESPKLRENCHRQLHDILNNPSKRPDILGAVEITDLNFGSGLPQVEGVKVLSTSCDKMCAEIDIGYHGGASFGIQTEICINFPFKNIASLPVSLSATLESFSGKLILECPPAGTPGQPYVVSFGALPHYNLRIGSTIGHGSKLVNVEKIAEVIQYVLRTTLESKIVAPNGFCFTMENGTVSTCQTIKTKELPQQTLPMQKQAALGYDNSSYYPSPSMQYSKPQPPSFSLQPPSPMLYNSQPNTIMPPKNNLPYPLFSKNGEFLNGDLRNRTFSVYSDS